MADQLRYSAGKPRLSYIYANNRALEDIDWTNDKSYHSAIEDAIDYTSGGPRSCLASAVGSWIMAMETECASVEGLEFSEVREGLHHDLLNFQGAVAELLAVYEYGAAKYAEGNYRQGANIRSYLDSFFRHAHKMDDGEVYDPDAAEYGFKTTHRAAALWNLFQALDQPASRDDRLPPVQFGVFDEGRKLEAFSGLSAIFLPEEEDCDLFDVYAYREVDNLILEGPNAGRLIHEMGYGQQGVSLYEFDVVTYRPSSYCPSDCEGCLLNKEGLERS